MFWQMTTRTHASCISKILCGWWFYWLGIISKGFLWTSIHCNEVMLFSLNLVLMRISTKLINILHVVLFSSAIPASIIRRVCLTLQSWAAYRPRISRLLINFRICSGRLGLHPEIHHGVLSSVWRLNIDGRCYEITNIKFSDIKNQWNVKKH